MRDNLFLHSLFFPPFCLHCEENIERKKNRYFCSTCASLFSLLGPMEKMRCEGITWGAALEYSGPVQTLITQLKFGKMPYLASLCGDFCLAQLCKLEWSFPDIIVPVPLSWLRFFSRGYNQSTLIAQHMSKKLAIPLCDALARKHSGLAQASLNAKDRKKLNARQFKLKKEVRGKTVLLIDDVVTTGATLRACAKALSQGEPKAIYALALAATPREE